MAQRPLILTQFLAMRSQQQMRPLQAGGARRQFGFNGGLGRAISSSVVLLQASPAKPEQHPQPIRFQRQAGSNARKQQNFLSAGIADGGELLESFFRRGVGQLED